MAGSFNRIILCGNLTRDPEIRYVQGGTVTVVKFAIAVNRKSKGGDETMFVDIVAFDKLGEICNTYLKKGMSTLVEGRLVIRKYDDKDGNKRTAVEVVASDMQMLDKKQGGDGAYATAGRSSEYAGDQGGGSLDDGGVVDDSEIPF